LLAYTGYPHPSRPDTFDVIDAVLLQPFGVEVRCGTAVENDSPAHAELVSLFRQCHLLVVRGNVLSFEEQARFVSLFGPIATGPSDFAYVSNADDINGALGSIALTYHSDLSFCPTPFRGGALHAVDVVDGQTSTRFVNAIHALRRVPEGLRRRIEDLRAVHTISGNPAERFVRDEASAARPSAEHPVVMTHPDTGEKILYVDVQQTSHIVGLDPSSSDALLDELYRVAYDPANVYEHAWKTGDLVIYDNLALQHGRDSLEDAGPRTLQRVTLAEKGFRELYPEYVGRRLENSDHPEPQGQG
jgi:taurine dioxygenase